MFIKRDALGGDDGVTLGAGWLRVPLPSGGTADFHHRWLRHQCDRERHPLTGERTLCSSQIADDVRPRRAALEGGALVVTWEPDGHESVYPLAWLDAHAYARDRVAHPPPSDVGPIIVDASGGLSGEVIDALLSSVHAHGAGVLRRGGLACAQAEEETEALIEALDARGYAVVGTHFGRIEDLRTDNTTNQNTDQLGYTDAGIDVHTDQPFLERPPRYQMLQCLRAADEGGESFVVDARAASRFLREIDREAWQVLTRTSARFHRRQKAFERIVDAPIVRDDDRGFLVRFSYFTLAPSTLPFDEMEPWYRAHDRFARLVRDPANQLRLRLEPGDVLLYDNHRMLHGRTSFRGARWVRGVYFDPA